MSQTEVVMKHFNRAYTLTPREARANYRIESLSSVISQLNKHLKVAGFKIVKTWKLDVTNAKYAEYKRIVWIGEEVLNGQTMPSFSYHSVLCSILLQC